MLFVVFCFFYRVKPNNVVEKASCINIHRLYRTVGSSRWKLTARLLAMPALKCQSTTAMGNAHKEMRSSLLTVSTNMPLKSCSSVYSIVYFPTQKLRRIIRKISVQLRRNYIFVADFSVYFSICWQEEKYRIMPYPLSAMWLRLLSKRFSLYQVNGLDVITSYLSFSELSVC